MMSEMIADVLRHCRRRFGYGVFATSGFEGTMEGVAAAESFDKAVFC